MNEPFSPYRSWLGLPPDLQHPNYYDLIGLDPSERDVAKIAASADRAMNRVRAIRPGPHAAHWARLLDELREAKRCLTDPGRRAAYDEDLASATDRAATADSPPVPERQERNPDPVPDGSSKVTPGQMLAPPMAVPVSGAPRPVLTGFFGHSSPPPTPHADPMAPFSSDTSASDYVAPPLGATAPPPQAVATYGSSPAEIDPMAPYGSTATASPTLADPMAPAVPAPDVDPMAPLTSVGAGGDPMAPVSASSSPVPGSTPVTGATASASIPVGTVVNQGLAKPATASATGTTVTSSTARKARRRRKNATPLVVGSGATLLIVMIAVLFFALGPPKDKEQQREVAAGDSVPPTAPPNNEPRPDVIPPATPPPAAPSTETSDSTTATPDPPAEMTGTSPGPTPGTSASPPTPEMPTAETPQMASPQPTPQPTPEPTPAPTPEPEVPAQTPAELTALGEAMSTARIALAEQNFDEANQLLASAESLAKTPDQQAKWERLKMLAHYSREFRRVLDNVLEGFEAGATIQITESTQVGVVEVADDRIVLRVAGRNKPYPRNDLPLGLGVAIADQYFAKQDPVSLVLKGAFVALHKQASPEKIDDVRQWWQQAIEGGVEIEGLLPVLDDSYDFLNSDSPSSPTADSSS